MKKIIILFIVSLSLLVGCTPTGDFMTSGSSISDPFYVQFSDTFVSVNETDVTGWPGLLTNDQHVLDSEVISAIENVNETLDINVGSGYLRSQTSGNNLLYALSTADNFYTQVYLKWLDPSPDTNDYMSLVFRARNSVNAEISYAQIINKFTNITSGNESSILTWTLMNNGEANPVMQLTGDGTLYLDEGTDIFDEYDDAIRLKRAFSQGEKTALKEIGVIVTDFENGKDVIDTQKLLALLAGGVYQNRDRIDDLEFRLSQLEGK